MVPVVCFRKPNYKVVPAIGVDAADATTQHWLESLPGSMTALTDFFVVFLSHLRKCRDSTYNITTATSFRILCHSRCG